MEKVAVIILNFKVKELTLKCIKSVQNSSYSNFEIIVVDNNSKDGLDESVPKGVEFIQTGDNLGYAGGNNVGIKEALKKECKLILVLNPDTTLEKDAIKNLVEGLEKHNADLANPKIYFDGTKKIWLAGKLFDRANVLASHRGVNEEDQGQYNSDEEVNYVNGAALLVKSAVFEKIGFFDESFFMYLEDTDFSERAKKAGFKMVYLPRAIVYHKNAQSTGLGSSLQDYFITRNRMLFAKKHLSFRTQFALLREALRNIGNPVRRMAFFDFLLGKLGKGSLIK